MTAKAASREDEYQRILEWRQAAFQELGVTYPDSWEMALAEVDVHTATDLVQSGCPAELLRSILV